MWEKGGIHVVVAESGARIKPRLTAGFARPARHEDPPDAVLDITTGKDSFPLQPLDRSHSMKTRLSYVLALLLVGAGYLVRENRIEGGNADPPPEAPSYQRSTSRRISTQDAASGSRERKTGPRAIPGMRGELPPRDELIASGLRASLDRNYGDFIASLQLSGAELEYFEDLLTVRMAVERDLTMRWLNAAAAEKDRLLQQINDRQPENTEAISRFLNHSGDLAAFLEFEQQIPERQSLNGFVLEGSDRQRLIGILHGLRIASGEEASTRLADLDSIISTGNTNAVQQRWKTADQKLPELLSGILPEGDTHDFLNHWTRVRENQLREYAATIRYLDTESHRSE